MSTKPSKRIAAGAAALAIAGSLLGAGAASAASPTINTSDCVGKYGGTQYLCSLTEDTAAKAGMFSSIPVIGPLLDSLFGSLGS